MTMRGGSWTPTPLAALPPIEQLFTLLADNTTGQISARDLRDVLDEVLSLIFQSAAATTAFPANPKDGQRVYNKGDNTINIWNAATGAWIPVGGGVVSVQSIADLPTTNVKEGALGYVKDTKGLYVLRETAPGVLTWVPTTSVVTVLSTAGQTPGTNPPANPPAEGDLLLNIIDHSSWAYDGGAGQWYPLAHSPNVTVSHTGGQDPVTNPPAKPEIGDWYINDVDGFNWIYAVTDATTVPATMGWQPATPTTGHVYVADTSKVVPSNPTAAQTAFAFPLTAVLKEGDRFVNRTDHVSWVYAPDPKNAGALTWIELAAENAATLSTKAKEVPENPGAGETAYVWTVPPKVGDIFVNRVDGMTWARVKNPAPGGAAAIWEPLSSPEHGTATYITDTDPTAPFTAANNYGFGPAATVEPDPATLSPRVNDFWINSTTRDIGIFTGPAAPAPAVGGAVPGPLPPTGSTKFLGADSVQFFDSTATTAWPSPDPGAALLVDTATDRLVGFTNDGVAFSDLFANQQVFVDTTPGNTPLAGNPGEWLDPAQGDVFINRADGTVWIASYSGATLVWEPLPSGGSVVTVSGIPNAHPVAAAVPALPSAIVVLSPKAGDRFENTANSISFVFDGTNWVRSGPINWHTSRAVDWTKFDAAHNWGMVPYVADGSGTTPDQTIFTPQGGDIIWYAPGSGGTPEYLLP